MIIAGGYSLIFRSVLRCEFNGEQVNRSSATAENEKVEAGNPTESRISIANQGQMK
nr:MAG TPA: hypothetical protein [Caudoviricetes sp.]